MQDIDRLLTPIKNKIFRIVGRGILEKVKSSEKTQMIQITGLKDEVVTDIEWLQTYGYTCYPKVTNTAEALIAYLNGNRDQGIAIAVHDREKRPTDLASGEVCIYDHNDNRITIKQNDDIHIYSKSKIRLETQAGNKITMDSTGIIVEDKNSNKVTMSSTGMKLEDKNSNTIDMVAAEIKFNGTNMEILQ